jgi:hypothetical protein
MMANGERSAVTDQALRAALVLLALGVAVGAALRIGQVTPLPWLHVGKATHTHSHTLYFGWAGVALFALFFERLGVPERLARAVAWALVATGVATFGVFWRFGYETPGVVVAAASLGPFGAAVATTLWHATLNAGLALGVGRELVLQRHAVVLGIHLLVVGVVTAGLLVLLELRRASSAFHALALHQASLALMLGGLGAAVTWPGRGPLLVAAAGGVLLVASQAWAASRTFLPSLTCPDARPLAVALAVACVGAGCAPPGPPPPPPPPKHEAPATLRACVAAAFGPVPTILSAIDRLNALPRPVDVPCFVASLGRPLSVVATTSVISAQPAAGLASPRIFLLSPTLAISVVPDGNGAPLIEFGEWMSPTRTLKGELALPVTEDLPLDAAFTHVKYSETLTTCALCHREETPHPTLAGAYVSEAYRPAPRSLVALPALQAEHEACVEAGDEGPRCALFHALFDFGAVEPGAFDAQVSTFP